MSQDKEYLLRVRELAELLTDAIADEPNGVVLSALLSVYTARAEHCQACRAGAATAALQAGADLMFNHQSGPAGPIH